LNIQRNGGDEEQIRSSEAFVTYLLQHLPSEKIKSSVVEFPVSHDDSKFLIELGFYEDDSVLMRYTDLETRRHWHYVAHYDDSVSVIDILNVVCSSRGKKHRYKCDEIDNRGFHQFYDRVDYRLDIGASNVDLHDEYFSDCVVAMHADFRINCPGFSSYAQTALSLTPQVYPDCCSILYELYPDSVYVIWNLQQFDVKGSEDFGDMCGFDLKESAKMGIHYLSHVLSEFPAVDGYDEFVSVELFDQEMRRFWKNADPVLYCDFDDEDGFLAYSDHCAWLNIGMMWIQGDEMDSHVGTCQ